MSTTTYEVSQVDFQAIELEPLGYPIPTASNRVQERQIDGRRLETDNFSSEAFTNRNQPALSQWQATVIIAIIACLTVITSLQSGFLIVALPTVAKDLGLPDSLFLWPTSASALASGCTLLIFGSIADIVGGKKVYLAGVLCFTLTTIASGVCRNSLELILFRALEGVALSMCMPSSIILITNSFPDGTYRNIAFACLGAGQPIGFSIGLVLGGVFVESIGWRFGYYIGAIVAFAVFIISIFGLPPDPPSASQTVSTALKRMAKEIDWVGCMLLSSSLGMMSYALSVLADSASKFIAPAPLTVCVLSALLFTTFIIYARRQERLGHKVIIPPSIFHNRVFTSLCLAVFLVWGVFDVVDYFTTLFYQSIQHLSAIQTSIRFLPLVVTGATTNFLTGFLVKKVRADALIFGAAAITALAPLLMAIVKPEWSYWTCAFIATACIPVAADVLFTVANLVITSVFPPKAHGVAGGVFNTISNIGTSFGLAIAGVISSSVAMTETGDRSKVLLDSYKASFWFCFAANATVLFVVAFGLRKIGKVGIKAD